MPELPETETIARDLDGVLRGAVVRSAKVWRADVLRDPRRGGLALRGPAAEAFAGTVATALTGARLERVSRRAKSIVLRFADERSLVVTPRFTGALLLGAGAAAGIRAGIGIPRAPHPHDCATFVLDDDRTLSYRDVRRLGTLALLDAGAFDAWSSTLGPEPLDPELSMERFSGILRGSNRAVKSVLMDQRRLAGIGNIYANEACSRAGLRPARRASRVTRAEAARLLGELRALLTESIALRGTTFRDFQDAYGAHGGFAKRLMVYGRGGAACRRCGATLRETHAIEGRSTVWCPQCQR